MMSRTHITTGMTAGALFAGGMSAAGVPDLVCLLAVPVVGYGATLPDIDHPSSFITFSLGPVTIALSWLIRGGPIGWWTSIGYGPWKREIGFGAHLFPWRCPHRGPTHRAEFFPWVVAVIVALGAWFLPGLLGAHWWVFSAAAALGVLTHIWGDARTISGVPFGGNDHFTIGRTFVTGSTRADADTARNRGEISWADWTWFARHNEEVLARTIYRPAMYVAMAGAAYLVIQP